MDEVEMIAVEVAYALPDTQFLLALDVPWGTTLAEAVELSGLREKISGLALDDDHVGVFGKKRSLDFVLRNGDRVEIYRPMIADPKEVRRQRAKGKA
jgi:putative ubiquitin-RnfH superfamily antitoxin RatB of RatAB toxin-antitoxin module